MARQGQQHKGHTQTKLPTWAHAPVSEPPLESVGHNILQ